MPIAMPGKLKPWRRLGSKVVGDYRVFRLMEHHTEAPHDLVQRTAYTIEAADWVNVIPITPDGDVVMVRQYRHGVDDFTLEIPGGLCDPGEDPTLAAARELREETGYAGEVTPLGWVLPNPAIQTNRCHVFLVRDARRVGEPEPDATEDLEVVTEPLALIPARIADGTIRHALVIAAFATLERRLGLPTLTGALGALERTLAALIEAHASNASRSALEQGRLEGLRAAQQALRDEAARLLEDSARDEAP